MYCEILVFVWIKYIEINWKINFTLLYYHCKLLLTGPFWYIRQMTDTKDVQNKFDVILTVHRR